MDWNCEVERMGVSGSCGVIKQTIGERMNGERGALICCESFVTAGFQDD